MVDPKKIVLISMPFGAIARPALGISLLKAGLHSQQLPCEIKYLNFTFAEFVGGEEYNWVSQELPYTAFAGDWTFTAALHGPDDARDARYLDEILRSSWRLSEGDIHRLMRIRQMVLPFLSYCLETIPWDHYAMVGFTSTLEQNIASLALAKGIKKLHPEIAIIFGGANCEAEMGVALHSLFPFVDFVCTGEGENTLPLLARSVLERKPANYAGISGLVYRDHGRSVHTGPAQEVRHLDDLPFPDYSEYFDLVQSSPAAIAVTPAALIETSRGCWWGAKSRCMFCGLNGEKISYRSKSPERAVAEFRHLADVCKTGQIEAVDNILDMTYFSEVLPQLARDERSFDIFYEVKANLTKEQLRLLKSAGVGRIQPGIESLNDHVLKLMRKGTTTLQNVQMLKWCCELGIAAYWNIIYGFPGETAEDYVAQLEVLKLVSFLDPPYAHGPIRLDRFSPYFQQPWKHGIRNVRPFPAYRFLYPYDSRSLADIAYSFDYDPIDSGNLNTAAAPLIEFIELWRSGQLGHQLCWEVKDDTVVITDSRYGSVEETTLSPLERIVYDRCDSSCSMKEIEAAVDAESDVPVTGKASARAVVDGLIARKFMMTDGERYLSLGVPKQPVRDLGVVGPYHIPLAR